ncbi:MAG: glycosyltransferase family 4 protein [Candidatus Riflebacteria bacterium]|nr:glycosyltransferase family 4 protein [Candidatus Riflebacteria bacterium]
MKLAHVHADLPGDTNGGVAHQVHRLANALVRRGHDLTMVTFSAAPPDALYRVRTLDGGDGIRRSPVSRLVMAGVRFARQRYEEFDLVHFHGDNQFCFPGVPSVRTFYGSALDELIHATSWRWRLAQLATYPLEIAGWFAARRSVGISRATVRSLPLLRQVVPCGVDLTLFAPGERSPGPSILFVGTLDGRKRGRILLDAFRAVVRPAVPEAQLWLVTDQEVSGDGVVWHGRPGLEALARLYGQAWVFCLPSSYEGFGIPYVEALAAGAAVVATPNAGALEILQGGLCGRIAPDDRVGETIVELLGAEDARVELSRRGRTRAGDFAMEKIAATYEAIYRELIAAGGTRVHGLRETGPSGPPDRAGAPSSGPDGLDT